MKKSALVMSVVAAFALTAISFDSTAEAAFGLKLPAIGSVIKGGGPKSSGGNISDLRSSTKIVEVVVKDNNAGKVFPGVPVYMIKGHPGNETPSINDRNEVCYIDADYRLLGYTNANGVFLTPKLPSPYRLMVGIPGYGVRTQSFSTTIASEVWKVSMMGKQPAFRRIEFTGKAI